MNIIDLCDLLCARTPIDSLLVSQEVIPSSHMQVYYRVELAEQLGTLIHNPFAYAALIRTALSQEEDDRIRVACVQQIVNSRFQSAESVLFALLFDNDDELVKAGVEGLVLLNSSLLEKYASYFHTFSNVVVRELFSKYVIDRDIPLYKLDPPSWRGGPDREV